MAVGGVGGVGGRVVVDGDGSPRRRESGCGMRCGHYFSPSRSSSLGQSSATRAIRCLPAGARGTDQIGSAIPNPSTNGSFLSPAPRAQARRAGNSMSCANRSTEMGPIQGQKIQSSPSLLVSARPSRYLSRPESRNPKLAVLSDGTRLLWERPCSCLKRPGRYKYAPLV
jgi:hypothetical protein